MKGIFQHLMNLGFFGVRSRLQLIWAKLLFRRGRYQKAVRVFTHLASRHAIPEARKMEAWIQFKTGNFAVGWPPYPGVSEDGPLGSQGQSRFKNPSKELKRIGMNEWHPGVDLTANTLIWLDFDSSLGGEILCLTLFSEFQRRWDVSPILVVDSRLVGFAQLCFPDTTVLGKQPKFDRYKGLAESFLLGRSLLRLIVSAAEDFSSIGSNPIAKSFRSPQTNGGLRVGISWKTTNKSQGKYRNVPLRPLVRVLSEFPWEEVKVLQHCPTPGEMRALRDAFGSRLRVTNPSESIERFAREVVEVDYVVTADNSVLHLAGSIGIPTFALLSRPSYWAWPESGESSRWFDSVRLLHQRTPGNWKEPLKTLQMRLRPLFPEGMT